MSLIHLKDTHTKQQLCWKYSNSQRFQYALLCFLAQRQEMTASTETLDLAADSAPHALPYHSNTSTLRSADSPKREATEIYLKSKALLDSRRMVFCQEPF